MNIQAPIFIDTAPIIYYLEKNPEFGETAAKLFKQIIDKNLQTVSSYLTLSEVLIKPLKSNNLDLTRNYHQFFNDLPNFSFANFEHSTALLTAQIRANHNFKLADAANLAVALEANCKTFLTNDKNLENFPELKVVLISSL